jgi:hypothetical protein
MVENPLVPSLRRAPPPATCTSPSAVSRAGELATPAPLSNRDGCRRCRRRSGRVRGLTPPPLNEQLPADSPPPSRPRTPAARRRWPLLRPYSPPPASSSDGAGASVNRWRRLCSGRTCARPGALRPSPTTLRAVDLAGRCVRRSRTRR